MSELVMKYQQYAEYKDSGVEWLGEVPSHWEVTRAKFVSEIFVPQRNKPELNEVEGILWATMEDMANAYINETTFRVSEKAAIASGSKKLPAGAVIASCVGNFGVTSINRVDVIINQQLQAFVPTNIKAEYLREVVFISKSYFELIGTAATLIYVNKQGFENLPVLLPSKQEQQNIFNFLDHETAQIDTLIEKQQSLIQLLKEKRQAVISHAVTKGLNPDSPMKDSGVEWLGEVPEHWEVGSLGYYATLETGATPSRANPKYWDGDIPWVKTGEVKYDTIYDTEEKITDLAVLHTSVRVSPVGTLLMAMYGQGITRGRVALLGLPAAYNQACVAITVNEKVWNEYIKWFFIAGYHAIRDGGNETSQMNLNADLVRKFKVLVPPKNEQKEIISFLLKKLPLFDDLLDKANEQIQLMQERRTALISAAVTGKIDVRGWRAPESH